MEFLPGAVAPLRPLVWGRRDVKHGGRHTMEEELTVECLKLTGWERCGTAASSNPLIPPSTHPPTRISQLRSREHGCRCFLPWIQLNCFPEHSRVIPVCSRTQWPLNCGHKPAASVSPGSLFEMHFSGLPNDCSMCLKATAVKDDTRSDVRTLLSHPALPC